MPGSTPKNGNLQKGPDLSAKETTAITLEKVTKVFTVDHGAPNTLKSALLSNRRHRPEQFTALNEIDLDVDRGETVAVIGKNGSGKSTMLRLIGRVYLPTKGKVETNGRMSTMLDLGAGFHPDLTGEENIYFNAAIMGLKSTDIKGKIDSIVAFAELSEFIDAPVRTYSAGMLMRLGFAIAVETGPEILLVDEVLAVGDAYFQEKCYNRIRSFQQSKKTIVFVTHDLESAKKVASRTVWLDNGNIAADGNTDEVIASYISRFPHESAND